MVARRGAAPLTRPSPYLTARPTSTFHSRVLCSDLQVMMSVPKEAIFEVKFQSCSIFNGWVKITQLFAISAVDEVSREREYVGAAPL